MAVGAAQDDRGVVVVGVLGPYPLAGGEYLAPGPFPERLVAPVVGGDEEELPGPAELARMDAVTGGEDLVQVAGVHDRGRARVAPAAVVPDQIAVGAVGGHGGGRRLG